MHIILLRHASRIDKSKYGKSPGQSKEDLTGEESFNWLSNFDPPLDPVGAFEEMEHAFKRLQSVIPTSKGPTTVTIHSSPYNRCIQTSELLLDKVKKSKHFKIGDTNQSPKIKLRVDQALSEWLNENYSLNYLPPNDDGYSMINNINAYLNQPENSTMNNDILNDATRNQLKQVKDSTWSYNQLGHCGEYGESPKKFTKRCFHYLIYLLQYYYIKQDPKLDKETVVFVVSHGAVISTILQILLGRSIFNEVPLCTPIYFKQSDKRRSLFKLMDYDFNLNDLLGITSDQEFYRVLSQPIDMTKLDPDNLTSELTIGTTGHTTIIQSIPQNSRRTRHRRRRRRRRKRRNTVNLGDKEHDSNEEGEVATLKQTRSSKQLYLLNKDTDDEKVIDLNKLHSYFGGSDSDSESTEITTSSDEETRSRSIFRGRISSLSSFNEENKNKFLLNSCNFYSKPDNILDMDMDPYSHFFKDDDDSNEQIISRNNSINTFTNEYSFNSSNNNNNTTNDYKNDNNNNMGKDKFDDSAKLFKRFGTNESLKDLVPKNIPNIHINDDYNYSSTITDDSSIEFDDSGLSGDEDYKENGILSFGARRHLHNVLKTSNTNKEAFPSPVLHGTFSKKNLRSNPSLTKLLGSNYKLNSVSMMPSVSTSTSTSSVMSGMEDPLLISSSNKNLMVRGASQNETLEPSKSKQDLRRLLLSNSSSFQSDADNSSTDDGDDEEGWFGGFSR